MATFFGEILPVVSRAVEDEESDDEYSESSFLWKPSDTKEIKLETVNNLVISIGVTASGFLTCYTEYLKEVAAIEEIGDSKDKLCAKIYCDDLGTTFYCICNSYIQPDNLWCVKDKIFANLHCKVDTQVYILTTETIYNYQSHKPMVDLSLPFVKSLCTTTKSSETPLFEALEQPNMVKGLGTAVLAHCELNKVPAVMYVCYTESITPDIATVHAFLPLLNTRAFKNNKKVRDKALGDLKSLLSSPAANQGLYI